MLKDVNFLRRPPQWSLSPATATMAIVSGDRHSDRCHRHMSQWSHIQQSFHWLKVSPITHTLCCDKNSAEFNFTHHMRYPPRSSWWINRYTVHSVLIKSLLKKYLQRHALAKLAKISRYMYMVVRVQASLVIRL